MIPLEDTQNTVYTHTQAHTVQGHQKYTRPDVAALQHCNTATGSLTRWIRSLEASEVVERHLWLLPAAVERVARVGGGLGAVGELLEGVDGAREGDVVDVADAVVVVLLEEQVELGGRGLEAEAREALHELLARDVVDHLGRVLGEREVVEGALDVDLADGEAVAHLLEQRLEARLLLGRELLLLALDERDEAVVAVERVVLEVGRHDLRGDVVAEVLPLDVHLAVEQGARVPLLEQLALLLGQVRLHVRGAEGGHHRRAELRDGARAAHVPVVVREEVVRPVDAVLHAAVAQPLEQRRVRRARARVRVEPREVHLRRRAARLRRHGLGVPEAAVARELRHLLELAVGVPVRAALVRVDRAREGDVVDVAVGLVRELADEDVKLLVGGLEPEPREAGLELRPGDVVDDAHRAPVALGVHEVRLDEHAPREGEVAEAREQAEQLLLLVPAQRAHARPVDGRHHRHHELRRRRAVQQRARAHAVVDVVDEGLGR
eukprot:scaffold90512_cov72-Phaeocystis_antarctica.AAC.9